MAKQKAGINPLPSLIRASSWDAGCASARKHGRAAWNLADKREAIRTQERLIRACYSRKGEGPKNKLRYIRFGIAEQMQTAGLFTLDSDLNEINAIIDRAIAA